MALLLRTALYPAVDAGGELKGLAQAERARDEEAAL